MVGGERRAQTQPIPMPTLSTSDTSGLGPHPWPSGRPPAGSHTAPTTSLSLSEAEAGVGLKACLTLVSDNGIAILTFKFRGKWIRPPLENALAVFRWI